ncbi:MAG: hypothetical protein ABJF10_09090 [Chthoniobacter sp.]|uniref:hypothetical protein n=1 Tax=Chthoniobacter sp. TaxID=2510640 RepID=UPI0032A1732F
MKALESTVPLAVLDVPQRRGGVYVTPPASVDEPTALMCGRDCPHKGCGSSCMLVKGHAGQHRCIAHHQW